MIVVVSSAIVRKDDEFLLIKETKPSAVGKWGLPGGKLEEAESIIDCLRREVREETGYQVTSEKLVGVVNKPNSHEGNTVIKFVFVCTVANEPEFSGQHKSEYMSLDSVRKLALQGLMRGDEIAGMLESVSSNSQGSDLFLQIL